MLTPIVLTTEVGVPTKHAPAPSHGVDRIFRAAQRTPPGADVLVSADDKAELDQYYEAIKGTVSDEHQARLRPLLRGAYRIVARKEAPRDPALVALDEMRKMVFPPGEEGRMETTMEVLARLTADSAELDALVSLAPATPAHVVDTAGEVRDQLPVTTAEVEVEDPEPPLPITTEPAREPALPVTTEHQQEPRQITVEDKREIYAGTKPSRRPC